MSATDVPAVEKKRIDPLRNRVLSAREEIYALNKQRQKHLDEIARLDDKTRNLGFTIRELEQQIQNKYEAINPFSLLRFRFSVPPKSAFAFSDEQKREFDHQHTTFADVKKILGGDALTADFVALQEKALRANQNDIHVYTRKDPRWKEIYEVEARGAKSFGNLGMMPMNELGEPVRWDPKLRRFTVVFDATGGGGFAPGFQSRAATPAFSFGEHTAAAEQNSLSRAVERQNARLGRSSAGAGAGSRAVTSFSFFDDDGDVEVEPADEYS